MKIKLLFAALSAVIFSGCSEAPAEQKTEITKTAPIERENIPFHGANNRVFTSDEDITEQYSTCYITSRNEEHCKSVVAEQYGVHRSEEAIEEVVTERYLYLYSVYNNDDIAEEQCAEKYGVETCDEIEDRYEHITSPKGSKTAEVAGAVASGAIVGGVLASKRKKEKFNADKEKLASKTPTTVKSTKLVPAASKAKATAAVKTKPSGTFSKTSPAPKSSSYTRTAKTSSSKARTTSKAKKTYSSKPKSSYSSPSKKKKRRS